MLVPPSTRLRLAASRPIHRALGSVSHRGFRLGVLVCALAALFFGLGQWHAAEGQSDEPFTNFETEPVRPLAMSPDGEHLYALNIPDDRLVIYAIGNEGLEPLSELPVGMRPVALAASDNTVWVSSHLSDAVIQVDVGNPVAPRVVRSIPVGDEPRDIVLAGPRRNLVLVATARRSDFFDPSAPRASVWIIDAETPDQPPQTVDLFGTKPRALAVSADGNRAYAAIFKSGNRTSVVHEIDVEAGPPTPVADPPNQSGEDPPQAGLIVRYNDGRWEDSQLQDWSEHMPFELPDNDVFTIDLTGNPTVEAVASGVGTTLFNMAVHPTSGEVWVSNAEARNHVRFEPKLRGHAVDNRITRIEWRAGVVPTVSPVDLNPHIRHEVNPGPADEVEQTLAMPVDLVFEPDGSRAYVAAFQSSLVGVLNSAGTVVDRYEVGFGPGGLALDSDRRRLYVLNRLDGSIDVLDLQNAGARVETVSLGFDPTPDVVHTGRPFLYDARLTSGHGDMACSSCHVFADQDGLAWNLGNPLGAVERIPFNLTHENFLLKPRDFKFHPMKGPMVTQSFRGMAGAGAMHWRGDRHGPDEDPTDEIASFAKFNPAFVDLNGTGDLIADAEMEAFAEFLLTIKYPPNPVAALDRSMTPEQQAGFDFFTGDHLVDSGVANCEGCHSLPTGTNGLVNFEGSRSGQDFKVPHLRNLYEKVGRFDVEGPVVTGFGFSHDGAVGTLEEFLHADVFAFPGETEEEQNTIRHELAEFMLAFDTGLAPAVGQVITAAGPLSGADKAKFEVLRTRDRYQDCDLVAHGWRDGVLRGWLLDRGEFTPDLTGETPVTVEALIAESGQPRQETTFVCVPPGNGPRSALDRDMDGYLNGDERRAGSDPADPASTPDEEPPTVTPRTTDTATPTSEPVTPSATHAGPRRHIYLPVGLNRPDSP